MSDLRNSLWILTATSIAVVTMWLVVLPSVHAQSPPDAPLFVRASVDNDRPYLGQQITYIFKLYQKSGITLPSGDVRYESPDFAGFWNSQSVEQDEYTETIDSNEYRVIELRTVLFPTVLGTIAIEAAALTVSDGTTGGQGKLEAPPVTVQVRPLPSGSPGGFTGAVGRFDISAEADSAAGQVNEPVQLRVTVSGEGNIEALPDPAWPEFAGWRVIESPADTDSQVVAGQITGSRTYGIVLVPEQAGELTIPEIGYTHFDPGLGEYVKAATAPIVISVAGADGLPEVPPIPDSDPATEEEAPEMRPIKPVPPSLSQAGRELTGSTFYWAAWSIPALVIVGAALWRRRRARLETTRAGALRRNALPDAQEVLSHALTTGVDPRAASAQAVLSYLSARLETPVSGLTRQALLRRLREAGVGSDLERRVEDTLSAGEATRYSPPSDSSIETRDYSNRASQLLSELEGAIGQ